MPTLENTVPALEAPAAVAATPAVAGKPTKKAAPKKAAATKKDAKKAPAAKEAPKKAPAKKEAPKAVAAPKKAEKPAKAPKAAKEAGERTKKDGLRTAQVRILAALHKGGELTRSLIAEKAPVDVATCVEYIGSDNDEKRLANDKKHFPSLISLGYVKRDWHPNKETDAQGPTHYTITAAGKKALEAAIAK